MAVILTSLLLLFMCLSSQALEAQNFTKTWPGKRHQRFVVSSDITTNDGFLFANCKYSVCNVTIDLLNESDATSNQRTCRLKLPGRKTDVIELRRFDEDDKIVLIGQENSEDNRFHIVYISILRMSNCEASHPVEYAVDINSENIIFTYPLLHGGGFEVFVANQTMCAGVSERCHVSFDKAGQLIGNPVPFDIELAVVEIQTVSKDSPPKNLFIRGYGNDPIFMVKYINAANEVTDLISERAENPFTVHASARTSNAYDFYGICRPGSQGLYCAQFDATGKTKMNVTIPKLRNGEFITAVHNLAEGELLLLTTVRTGDSNSIEVRKISDKVQGELKSLSIRPCVTVNPYLTVNVVETEEEFVFYHTCSSLDKYTQHPLELDVLRVPKKVFV